MENSYEWLQTACIEYDFQSILKFGSQFACNIFHWGHFYKVTSNTAFENVLESTYNLVTRGNNNKNMALMTVSQFVIV